jgi:hypothetical protein
MHEPVEYDQTQVDAYLDHWHQEGEGQAMYDAWLVSDQPYDFTGASYLEEYMRPLREKTPLMERFTRRVECDLDTAVELEEFTLEPGRDNLQRMLDIDEAIFEDGDYFLRKDPGFLDDLEEIEVVALGQVLADISTRHFCCDFWPRLRALGPTPQMVREAKGWWLLANIELEPENDFYSGRLDDALAEFHPKVEKIVAGGGDAVDGFLDSGWEVHSVTQGLTPSAKRDLLISYLNRDKAAVERIYDRAASEAEGMAQKKRHGLFLRGRTKRVQGIYEPGFACDTSFLQFVGEWEEVTLRASSKAGTLRRMGFSRVIGQRRGRPRCSRRTRRAAGCRRSSSSRDDGGGGGGDDHDPEPLAQTGAFLLAENRLVLDIAVTSFGMQIGENLMGLEGKFVGGAVAYLWCCWRWHRRAARMRRG